MKEIYESPELELLSLQPQQKVALIEDTDGGRKEETVVSQFDIDTPL